MKILFLLNAYEPDGPGQLMLDLTARLAMEHGFACETAALSRGGALMEAFEAQGVRTMVMGAADGVWSQARRLQRHIAAGRYDAVHTNLLRADIIGRWAASRAGVARIVSTEHGIHTWDERGPGRRKWIARAYRFTARRAQSIVAVSRFVANGLREAGVPETKVQLIYNGIDTHRFQRATDADRIARRRQLGVAEDETLVLAAGKLTRLKGHALLLEAARLMRDRWRERKMRVVIAGDGSERRALETLANTSWLGDSVTFIGHVAEGMAATMSAADLFVQPSLMESFGLAAVEAMACGTPVVATRVGGVPEVMDDGGQGLLCAPTAVDLARRIDQALDSRAEWTAWGAAGVARARERFDVERMVRHYATLYGR